MTKFAVVEQNAPNKPPKLHAGELTPEAAREWDNACTTYFMHKQIDGANQVKMIVMGMVDTWYLTQKATSDAGTFTEYITALKDAWLETHWDSKLCKKVLGSQQNARTFYEWALELQNLNALLFGNAAHLTDEQLCNQLEANMCNDLITPVLRVKLPTTLTLKKWIEEVKELDDKRRKDLASHRKITEELYKATRRTQTTKALQTTCSSSYHSSSSRIGPLTQDEWTLLNDHNGCYKHQKFYVSHRLKECTNGPPDPSSYKTLTEADCKQFLLNRVWLDHGYGWLKCAILNIFGISQNVQNKGGPFHTF
jgi:hypothetical protein